MENSVARQVGGAIVLPKLAMEDKLDKQLGEERVCYILQVRVHH